VNENQIHSKKENALKAVKTKNKKTEVWSDIKEGASLKDMFTTVIPALR